MNRRDLMGLAGVAGLALVAKNAAAGSHATAADSGRDWTIDDLTADQRTLAQQMLERTAAKEVEFLDIVEHYNGSRAVEQLDFADEQAEHKVLVSRGEVIEKAGFYINHSKMAMPPFVPEAIWDRYYEFDFHARTPLIGQLHATVYFTYMANGKSAVSGYMDYTPGTWIEEDNQYLKAIVDEHCEAYGHDPERFRKMLNLPYHKDKLKAACVGGAFYTPPLLEVTPENVRFVTEANEKFIRGYLDLLDKRKDEPFTARDVANQAAMRKRWLEDHLFEDAFAMHVVPYEVWSFADGPPTVHW